jgi:2-polyprenyl-6-methoxyphenol hydroxylase-like FAD-dependent oxidoreductase
VEGLSIGCAQRIVDTAAVQVRKCYWMNGEGEVLMVFHRDKKEISGWGAAYMMWQPLVEEAVDAVVRAQSMAEVQHGWEAVGLERQGDLVEVTLNRMTRDEDGRRVATDEFRTVRARYVVGADGANGFVRDALGIEREDLGFSEHYLIVDTKPRRQLSEGAGIIGSRPITFGLDVFQIFDLARPRFLAPLGKTHRRFEWYLLPGETREEMERPETAYTLLAESDVTPADLEIVRQQVYTFDARLAQRWRHGSVFLIGDAAHTMPPHMGQGMCSGIRDAKSLAWKLDLVLRDKAPESMLDTYESERKPNAREWIALSIAEGQVSTTLDPEAAAAADVPFRAGEAPPIGPLPSLRHGILHLSPEGEPIPPAGSLSPQARVTCRGRTALLDDLVGRGGFSVIAWGADPRSVLSSDQLAFLDDLRTSFAHIAKGANGDEDDAAVDIDGDYASYFAMHGLSAIIIRPDFYVYGGVAELDGLPELVDELRAQIREAPRLVSVFRATSIVNQAMAAFTETKRQKSPSPALRERGI